jgi:hypothetical protein
MEIGRRKDAHTHHAYEWALRAKGDHAEAWEQVRAALAVGIQDPTFLYHAGVIALENGDAVAAKTYFEGSLTAAPVSEVAAAVRTELAAWGTPVRLKEGLARGGWGLTPLSPIA